MVKKIVMWLMILAGCVVLALAPGQNAKAKRLGERAEQAKEWPTISGTVITSRVAKASSSESYFPEISYRYAYLGKQYQSDQVFLGQVTFNEPAEARQLVAQAVPGQPVNVRVNPLLPSDAVLSRKGDVTSDSEATAIACFVLGPIFILLGGFGLLQIRRYSVPPPSLP